MVDEGTLLTGHHITLMYGYSRSFSSSFSLGARCVLICADHKLSLHMDVHASNVHASDAVLCSLWMDVHARLVDWRCAL